MFLFLDGTCLEFPTNSSRGMMGYMATEDGSHIKTVKDYLYFGEDKREKFEGAELVRNQNK